jgi:hypothetical protein
VIEKAVGKESYSASQEMTVGFAHYSEASGPMEAHQHAEEVVYIVSAQGGRLRYGESPEAMDTFHTLETGMMLHIPEAEWHVFEFNATGHVEIIFMYGRVDNIRGEDEDQK